MQYNVRTSNRFFNPNPLAILVAITILGGLQSISFAQKNVQSSPETCLFYNEDAATGTQSRWLDHFDVYEVTTDGSRYRLTAGVRMVDVHSDIVIERTSSSPVVIYSQSSETELSPDDIDQNNKDGNKSCAQILNDGFDVDVMKFRSDSNGKECPTPMAFNGLHYPDTYNLGADKWAWSWPDCQSHVRTLTKPRGIKKGDKFTLAKGHLKHGDRIEIQLSGDRIQDVATTTGCTGTGTSKSCSIKYSAEWGDLASVNIFVADFSRVVPFEKLKGTRRLPASTTSRVDLDHDLVIDNLGQSMNMQFGISKASNPDVLVEAEATDRDGKERTIKMIVNGGQPTLSGFQDGDSIKVVVKRRVQAGKAIAWRTETVHHFRAAAIGLHYAPTGDRKADYSTASAFLLPFESVESYGFAQTFAYSLYYRTREPGFWDHIGGGFHVSLLAIDSEAEDEPTFSLGLGGQITFGGDALHLGAGYDVRREGAYVIIGLSLDAFANAVKSAL